MVFDQSTLAGEWRAQVRSCEEQDIALHRDIAFALAVADLLELPDELPLSGRHGRYVCTNLPQDPASLAPLKAVARSAGREPKSEAGQKST